MRCCALKGNINVKHRRQPTVLALFLTVATDGADLHQLRGGNGCGSHGLGFAGLRVAPIVQNPDLLHARNRAARRAEFVREYSCWRISGVYCVSGMPG